MRDTTLTETWTGRRCAVQQRCTPGFLGLLDAREIVSASGAALRPLSQQLRLDDRDTAFEVISHYARRHAMREKNAFVAISDRAYVVS